MTPVPLEKSKLVCLYSGALQIAARPSYGLCVGESEPETVDFVVLSSGPVIGVGADMPVTAEDSAQIAPPIPVGLLAAGTH
jgi:hypothetical protein